MQNPNRSINFVNCLFIDTLQCTNCYNSRVSYNTVQYNKYRIWHKKKGQSSSFNYTTYNSYHILTGALCDISCECFRNNDHVNSLRPRQNRRHFADDVFKCNFVNENVWIPIKISLKFVPKGPINNILSLVQIMAWRRPGDKPLSEPMMVRLPTHICLTKLTLTLWNRWVITFSRFNITRICLLWHGELWSCREAVWDWGWKWMKWQILYCHEQMPWANLFAVINFQWHARRNWHVTIKRQISSLSLLTMGLLLSNGTWNRQIEKSMEGYIYKHIYIYVNLNYCVSDPWCIEL